MIPCVRCGAPITDGPGGCECVRKAQAERRQREHAERMRRLQQEDPGVAAMVAFVLDTEFGGQ